MKAGIVFGLLSVGLFGASTTLAMLLVGAIDSWMMAGLPYRGAGAGLATIHLSRGRAPAAGGGSAAVADQCPMARAGDPRWWRPPAHSRLIPRNPA